MSALCRKAYEDDEELINLWFNYRNRSWLDMSVENDLIEKIKEWQIKASSEADPFDKYLSLFISYNIFYNLYEKTITGIFTDFISGDSRRAIGTLDLVEPHQLFDILYFDLGRYLRIIPVFNEEYWPQEHLRNGATGVPLSQSLKTAYNGKSERLCIELLLKWLYKVRCNLVHGVKSYKDGRQRELLNQSSNLLDIILSHMVERYTQRFLPRLNKKDQP